MATIAENLDPIHQELVDTPTVQAGLINLLVWIRHQIEASAADQDRMLDLAQALDDQCAVLADEIIQNTPAEAPHADRAAQIQAEANEES